MNSLRARVSVSPDHRQQAIWIERAVELMPMDHKHPGTVSGVVDQGTAALDRAEKFLNQADFELVVISRKEYYLGAAMTPSNDLIYQLLLRLTPVPRRAPVPSVYYVANKVQGLRDVMAQ